MFKKYVFIVIPFIIFSITACHVDENGPVPGPDTTPDPGGTPQNQYPIDSASVDDINAGIASVRKNGGGILQLPAGEYHLGNTSFRVPAGVKIVGAGKDKTILHDATFNFAAKHGTCGDSICQLSSLSILNTFQSTNSYFEVSNVAGMRFDHCYFEGHYSTFCNTRSNDFVIVDNCEFRIWTSYGFYCFDDNSYYKNTPDTYTGKIGNAEAIALLGTDIKNPVFVEDCKFTGRFDHLMDGRRGARYIFRHNTIRYELLEGAAGYSGPLEGHGPTNPADLGTDNFYEGTNCIEIYDNVITEDQASQSGGVLIRSGIAVIYNNSISNKNWGVTLAVEDSPYHWLNDPYPAYNQPHGVWIWNNTFQNIGDGDVGIVWNSGTHIQADRDYFLRAPSPAVDGFTYTPYPYPHPYRANFPPAR
ncbi:MAG: hypothetical protein EHM64_04535 [Ignavibacteriae bacterium]|nr:MAG: hypothetical protein EHM64_04535 [Ignavibacteriota bacterium]